MTTDNISRSNPLPPDPQSDSHVTDSLKLAKTAYLLPRYSIIDYNPFSTTNYNCSNQPFHFLRENKA